MRMSMPSPRAWLPAVHLLPRPGRRDGLASGVRPGRRRQLAARPRQDHPSRRCGAGVAAGARREGRYRQVPAGCPVAGPRRRHRGHRPAVGLGPPTTRTPTRWPPSRRARSGHPDTAHRTGRGSPRGARGRPGDRPALVRIWGPADHAEWPARLRGTTAHTGNGGVVATASRRPGPARTACAPATTAAAWTQSCGATNTAARRPQCWTGTRAAACAAHSSGEEAWQA